MYKRHQTQMFVATQSANYATVGLIDVNNITEAVNDLDKGR